ncbi:hypothetical protein HPP92_014326 [Vanilla planifolia]|uniref:Alpha 1,4-glycosyltransferase domain-containing protein n=1 Tax=Vanilla planifolia TaxID=51239 RepID=A0A835UW41_VANPL|nr:hypothetical protein HPP92_014326 [Vanilla planifolia]
MDSPTGARLLKPLISRGFRLAAMDPDFGYLLKNTPAKGWYTSLRQGRLKPGNVPLGQNLSNLLRLAALYKFGGVYLDTDVIVLKDFSSLQNVVGAQSIDSSGNWSRLNNAVMVFEKRHPLVYEFLSEFAATFNGSRWGHNGPYLVSRVVERVKGWSGFNFAVVPPPAFYPVSWNSIEEFFDTPVDRRHQSRVEATLERIRRESFAVHLWNMVSRSMQVQERSLMERIFADCCLLCNSSSSSEKSVI